MNSNFQRETQTPMFIKIVLEDTIKDRRLEIPSEFVTGFGNSLRNPIILEVPNGKTWRVKIRQIGEKFWLVKGWVEFSEHYSLIKGHLLVFKYGGNSHFNVLIFDMTAMEIDYPSTSRDIKSKEIPAPVSDHKHIQENGGNLAGTSKVITSAIDFNSSNPWFKQSVTKYKYLHITYSFVKKHMKCGPKAVMFKVEDKAWPVELKIYPDKQTAMISGGVSAFLRDNSLKNGDVCAFELIANNVFNVFIFRI